MTVMCASASRKVLTACLNADLHYQLNGTPHHVFLEREAKKHIGQAKRCLLDVAMLGEAGASEWMAFFIDGMNDDR